MEVLFYIDSLLIKQHFWEKLYFSIFIVKIVSFYSFEHINSILKQYISEYFDTLKYNFNMH